LELEEALDVVVDVSSPGSSSYNSDEVIILDEDIGGFLAGVSTSNTHSETNISSSEGRSIVGTVSSYSDGMAHVSEASDHQVLVFRSASSHDHQVLSELLKLLSVLNVLLLLAILLLLNESTTSFVEGFTFHGDFRVVSLRLLDDVSLDGDGLGSVNVVSSHHSHADSSILDVSHSLGDFSSDSILDTNDSDESVFLLKFNVEEAL